MTLQQLIAWFDEMKVHKFGANISYTGIYDKTAGLLRLSEEMNESLQSWSMLNDKEFRLRIRPLIDRFNQLTKGEHETE